MRSTVALAGVLATGAALMLGAQPSPTSPAQADWPLYRHDLAGTGYSPLADITSRNVASLTKTWTYRLADDTAPATAVSYTHLTLPTILRV